LLRDALVPMASLGKGRRRGMVVEGGRIVGGGGSSKGEGSSEEVSSSAFQRRSTLSDEVGLSFTEVGRLLVSGGQDLAVCRSLYQFHWGDQLLAPLPLQRC